MFSPALWLSNKFKKLGFDFPFLVGSIFFVFLSYALYLVNFKGLLDADIAAEILNGREIFLRKSIYLTSWYYTSEIFLVRTPLFIALWMFLTENMFNAHILAVITEILLEILCFVYMGKKLEFRNKSIILGILLFFGIRNYETGILVGMGASHYATVHMFTFLFIGYYSATVKRKLKLIDKFCSVLIILMSFIFGISSFRLFVILFIPALFVHILPKICSNESVSLKNDKLLLFLIICTALDFLGFCVNIFIIRPLGFGPLMFQTSYTGGIVYAFQTFIPAFLTEFVHRTAISTIMENVNIFSLAFLNGFLCFIFFCLFACSIKLSWDIKDQSRIKIYYILLGSLLITFLSHMFFLPVIDLHIRYYIYFFVFISIVLAYMYDDLSQNNRLIRKIIIVVISFFIVTNSLYNIRLISKLKLENKSISSISCVEEVTGVLEKYDIYLAYSQFWNSNTVTVLTNGKYVIAGLNGDMIPWRYGSPYRYFSPDVRSQKTALIYYYPFGEYLDEKQPDNFNGLDKEPYNDAVKEAIVCSNTKIDIYILEFNIFAFPLGHDPKNDYINDKLPY